MFSSRHTHVQRQCKQGLLAAIACAAVCGAGNIAGADTTVLPRSYTTIPAAPADVAGENDGEDLLLGMHEFEDVPKRKPMYKRLRDLKVLSFSRNVEIGREEVQLKVVSPGKKRSIMRVEVHF